MPKEDHGVIIYPPIPGDGWRPCVRINESGRTHHLIRPAREEDPLPEHCERLGVEHIAPGVAHIRSVQTGPALVNSRAYEEGWERIFGGHHAVGQA